jgi:hypothetical protein
MSSFSVSEAALMGSNFYQRCPVAIGQTDFIHGVIVCFTQSITDVLLKKKI